MLNVFSLALGGKQWRSQYICCQLGGYYFIILMVLALV
jgi:hypothetical protein